MTALGGILSQGVQMVRDRGQEGLYDFVDRTSVFADEKRRRGGDCVARHFVNQVQYLSKVAFYRVYSDVWATLISDLEQRRGVDSASVSFLRYWHAQEAPRLQGDGTWIPDMLAGQILALHPISELIIRDPALCATVGRYFQNTVVTDGRYERHHWDLDEYWTLWHAILFATYEYRGAYDRSNASRATRHLRSSLEPFAESL